MPVILTPTQAKILSSLAEFKFLTTSQMLTLNISTQKSNLSNSLKPLKLSRRPFIGEMRFGSDPSKGKLESFYYLMNKGVKALIENGIKEKDEIKVPKGRSTLFSSDYLHRKITINSHIRCQIECQNNNLELLQFDRYFDKTGNNRISKNLRAKTSIKFSSGYLIADGSFLVSKGDQSKLFAIEIYNDRNTKRIIHQLKQHSYGIEESSLCIHFNIEKGHRVCSVFSHIGIMEAVMKRFNPDRYKDYYLFKTVDQMNDDFLKNWQLLSGKSIDLLDF